MPNMSRAVKGPERRKITVPGAFALFAFDGEGSSLPVLSLSHRRPCLAASTRLLSMILEAWNILPIFCDAL